MKPLHSGIEKNILTIVTQRGAANYLYVCHSHQNRDGEREDIRNDTYHYGYQNQQDHGRIKPLLDRLILVRPILSNVSLPPITGLECCMINHRRVYYHLTFFPLIRLLAHCQSKVILLTEAIGIVS